MNIFSDPNYFQCNCGNSPYVDRNHGLIITGNLPSIKNDSLRELFCKGPKVEILHPYTFLMLRKVSFLVLKNAQKVGLERKS